MQNSFDEAVNFVFLNEGLYADNPSDPGGATKYGISSRFLRALPIERLRKYAIFDDEFNIETLSVEQARMIYREEFWNAAPFDKIGNQRICNYVFDCAVHHGLANGVKILQRAMWAATGMYGLVHDDGILGSITLRRLQPILSTTWQRNCLLGALPAERAGFCRAVAMGKGEFLHGWLERCYRV